MSNSNITPYICKSGQLAVFLASSPTGTSQSIPGTVSVTVGSTALTTSQGQPAYQSSSQNPIPLPWIGSKITINGDSSATVYTITGGYGTNWVISPAYAGSSNASGATATLVQPGAPAIITGVYSAPTIQVKFGGTGSYETVQTYGPVYTPISGANPNSLNAVPFVAWLLQCGSIESAIVQNPGSNYVNPSVSPSGGGGSGLTFGSPILTGGVTSYLVSGGSGYASATASISGGGVSGVTVNNGGANYSIAPLITLSGGGGSGAKAISIVVNGIITAIEVINPGTGYNTSPTVYITTMGNAGPIATVAAPSLTVTGVLTSGSTTVTGVSSMSGIMTGMQILGTGTYPNSIIGIGSSSLTLANPARYTGSSSLTIAGKQAIATATVANGSVSSVNTFVPGAGYPSSPIPTVTLTLGGGSGATVTAVVSNTIGQIPVTNQGSNYTSPPQLIISDSGGSGAVAVPLMTGVKSSDIIEYSVSNNWISTNYGSGLAATSAPMTNYAGTLEQCISGFYNFGLSNSQKTLPLGMNYADNVAWFAPHNATVNWLNRAVVDPTSQTKINSITPDGRPLTISGTLSQPTFWTVYSDVNTNGIDNTSIPLPISDGYNGNLWTYVADELTPSNPTSMSISYSGATITQLTPTGGAGSPSIAGTSTVGVNQITLGSGGSGYTSPPVVNIINSVGSGSYAYAMINSNGQVYYINLVSPGHGYSGSVTIELSGGGGSGATATATIGNVLIGQTWQFSVVPNGITPKALSINVWKTTGGTYPYTLTNEYLFSPSTSASSYPNIPSRSPSLNDAAAAAWLTTPTNKYPSVIRFMGSEMIQALTNVVDPSDLKIPYDFTWFNRTLNSISGYGTVNPTGPRSLALTTIRTYSINPSLFPAGWNVTWSSPTVYLPESGTGVLPSSNWNGYGSTSGDAGPYKISPVDQSWINQNYATTSYYTAEFVTTVPHCIKSGQYVNIFGSGTFQVSNGIGQTVTLGPVSGIFNATTPVYVTGPYTFVYSYFGAGLITNPATGLPGGINNVAGSFSVNFSATVFSPDQQALPHISAAQIAGSYSGCDLWTNIPWAATLETSREIATQSLNTLPSGRNVIVEYSNEHWNNIRPTFSYMWGAGLLGIWGNSNSETLALTDQAYIQRASQHWDQFDSVFSAADRGSEVINVIGSLYVNTGTTSNMLNYAESNSITINAVAVAPYIDPPSDVTTPASAPSVVVTGGGSTGGNLPSGTYYLSYTIIDSLTGIETSIGSSRTSFTISAGNIPAVHVTIPSWGNTSVNIYLSQSGGVSGSESLYLSNQTSSLILLTSNTWTNLNTYPPAQNLQPSLTVAAAMLATHWPTSIAYMSTTVWSRAAYLDYCRHGMKYQSGNNFALNQQYTLAKYTGGPIPALYAYEGDLQYLVPTGVETSVDPLWYYLRNTLSADLYFDPNLYDWENTFYEFCQQNGFAKVACFFLSGVLGSAGGSDGNYSALWAYTTYESQPFGKGDGSTASNGRSVTNQFWTDTQASEHGNNASVKMKAWNDWADIANTAYTTDNYVLTGPTFGIQGSPSTNFTVTPGTSLSDTITFSDNGKQGFFIPSYLTWNNSNEPQSFTYTPKYIGEITLSLISNNNLTIFGSPIQYNSLQTIANSLILTGPIPTDYVGAIQAAIGVPVGPFIVTPAIPFTGTVNLLDSSVILFIYGSGTFDPPSLYFDNSDQPQSFTYTPSKLGNIPISIQSSGVDVSAPIYISVLPPGVPRP